MGFQWRKCIESLKHPNQSWRHLTHPYSNPCIPIKLKMKATEAGRRGQESKIAQSWFAWEKQWVLRPLPLVAKIQYLWEVCDSQRQLWEVMWHRENEMTRVTRCWNNMDIFEPLKKTVFWSSKTRIHKTRICHYLYVFSHPETTILYMHLLEVTPWYKIQLITSPKVFKPRLSFPFILVYLSHS